MHTNEASCHCFEEAKGENLQAGVEPIVREMATSVTDPTKSIPLSTLHTAETAAIRRLTIRGDNSTLAPRRFRHSPAPSYSTLEPCPMCCGFPVCRVLHACIARDMRILAFPSAIYTLKIDREFTTTDSSSDGI